MIIIVMTYIYIYVYIYAYIYIYIYTSSLTSAELPAVDGRDVPEEPETLYDII